MFEKFNAQLNLTQSLGICLVASLFITLWAYFLPESYNDIKRQEANFTLMEKLHLYVNRLFHYFTGIITRLFPFIAKPYLFYDMIIVITLIGVMIHWCFFKECLITLDEKRLFQPNYIPGTDKNNEYYLSVFFKGNNSNYKLFYSIFFTSYYFVIFFVLFRIFFGEFYSKPAYLLTPSWLRPIIK
jgi:hypothetical protein